MYCSRANLITIITTRKNDKKGILYATGAVFYSVNWNIAFRRVVNELYEAVSFLLSKQVQSCREITVGLGDAIHIGKLDQGPIPFDHPAIANPVTIQFQLVFRLAKEVFDRSALNNVGCLYHSVPSRCSRRNEDVRKSWGGSLSKPTVRPRNLDLSARLHRDTTDRCLPPHGDEMGVFGVDITCKLFGLNGDVFLIENAIGLEHRNNVEFLFQAGFHECFGWIPRVHQHIHRTANIQRLNHFDRQ